MDTVLREIREAEKKAKDILENAKKKNDVILQNARGEAKRLESRELEKYTKETEKGITKEKEKIEKEGKSIVEQGKGRAARLLKRSETNSNDTSTFLLKKFKNMLE